MLMNAVLLDPAARTEQAVGQQELCMYCDQCSEVQRCWPKRRRLVVVRIEL